MKTPFLSTRAGFSLVTATVVAALVGILAVFAVPRYSVGLERDKASGAFVYLAYVATAQERFELDHGRYCENLATLGVGVRQPDHFQVADFVSSDWSEEWQLRLTRHGHSSSYGEYTVVFDQEGYSDLKSSIPADLLP
jgi:type II secretory pathway pseudopilin PulG